MEIVIIGCTLGIVPRQRVGRYVVDCFAFDENTSSVVQSRKIVNATAEIDLFFARLAIVHLCWFFLWDSDGRSSCRNNALIESMEPVNHKRMNRYCEDRKS